MLALRRGKFRAFLKPTNSTVNKGYDGNSFTNSHDYEISLEIAVGPKGEISRQDVEITGGNDEHYIPGNPGIFISWIKPGSDADKVLRPGCQITKIDDVDVRNVSRQTAQNLLRFADQYAEINALTMQGDEVSQVSSNSKMVTWGGVSIDSEVDNNSDSGRGTDIIEKENKPNLDGGETISVKVPVGATGKLVPLNFEIQGGQDEGATGGSSGIVIKEIKDGSLLDMYNVRVGDYILKVNGFDVTDVPQQLFFDLLRAAEKVAKIQILKIPVSKDKTEVRVFEVENAGENEKIVEISTGPKGRLGKLGLKINGGRDRPCVPGDPGIFITTVKRGSVFDKVLGPGDKILKIDGTNVSNVPLRFALDRIRAADRRVRLHIKKADHTEHDSSERDRARRAWRAARSFSDEQLEEFKLAFSVYDRAGSGRINQKQMTELCRSLGHNITATDKDVIDTEFKLGGESKISFLDFVQLMTRITTSKQSDSDLVNAFEVFDRELKGFFRLHELEHALKEMPGGKNLEESEIADILAFADPDGDGNVSFQEFQDLVLPIFNLY